MKTRTETFEVVLLGIVREIHSVGKPTEARFCSDRQFQDICDACDLLELRAPDSAFTATAVQAETGFSRHVVDTGLHYLIDRGILERKGGRLVLKDMSPFANVFCDGVSKLLSDCGAD